MDSKSSRFIATIGPRTGCPLRTHGELFFRSIFCDSVFQEVLFYAAVSSSER